MHVHCEQLAHVALDTHWHLAADGRVCRSSLLDLARGTATSDAALMSDTPLPSRIIAMDSVENRRTGELLLVGGAEDGTLEIWSLA